MQDVKVIELFAGIGAFRQGLENQNIPHKVVAFSEIDKYAVEAYRAIHNDYYFIQKVNTQRHIVYF